ncbi:hypothetical protein AB1L42_12975 [Thalassoglobus sp. JC818]|uniref:PsbP-related protein n=1 Tax=Thalassoglobus sp. JC818 TaxID=3232136 RepID=UPI00345B011F
MTRMMTCVLTIMFAQISFGQDGLQPRMTFPVNGYSMTPLEAPVGETPYQSLIMFLAASEGFAPNVNVQIQPYPGTMQEYSDLSKGQFEQLNFQVLKENVNENMALWEYTGTTQSKTLHWYTAAHKRDNKVYLVTATALESQWERAGEKLKKCVDSFRLDQPNVIGGPSN